MEIKINGHSIYDKMDVKWKDAYDDINSCMVKGDIGNVEVVNMTNTTERTVLLNAAMRIVL